MHERGHLSVCAAGGVLYLEVQHLRVTLDAGSHCARTGAGKHAESCNTGCLHRDVLITHHTLLLLLQSWRPI